MLLTDHTGHLQRLLPLGPAPTGGWTHQSLLAAGRAALTTAPPLHTDRYTPSTAIAEHIRAAYPTCTAPTCTRTATGCDLDHDIPWPHGPTTVTNLTPRSRRCHRYKTAGIWRSHLHPDGTITWTTHTGITWTHHLQPLPGHAPGEGHHPT